MSLQLRARRQWAAAARWLGAAALLAILPIFAARATAHGPAAIEPDTVRKVKKATAYVRVELSNGKTTEGSGFFAMEPGIVLTNAHVVGMLRASSDKPRKVEIIVHSGQKDEFTVSATILGVDRVHDLAMLRVQGPEARWPAPLTVETDLTKLVETQKVYIFGFPLGARLGKEITVSESSIASFRNDGDGLLAQIQTNGGMHPGNSGGPVVDTRGTVVGVAVAGISGTAINFAVPSEKVHGMLQGRVQDVLLGEHFRDDKQIKLPIQTTFLDPLGRVREVKLEYWTGPAGPGRPASSKAPAPVTGDAERQGIDVDYKQGVAKHDLALPPLPAGKVYWLQATYLNKDGARQWGPATSFKASGDPLGRVPAKLIVNTDVPLRSMNLVSRNEFQIAKGKEKVVQASVMEMQLLEVLDKTEKGNAIKVVLGKGGFFFVDRGRKIPRHTLAQSNVRGTVFNYQADPGGRLTSFGFVKYNVKDPQQKAEADDMAGDVATSYQAASLGMPNRELAAQETWQEKIRMLLGQGEKKDVIDLVLTCTYEGSRTVNGKTEALIRMTGNVKLIKSPRPILGEPVDKVTGSAVFNVTDGMVSKLKLSMRAEFETDGLLLTDIFEIDYTRLAGNLYNLKMPTGGPVATQGKIILQQNTSLTANDPMNPKRPGTRQKVFAIKLLAGKTYVIDMKQPPGSKLDPYLRLEDNTGKILAEDDDGGGKLDARIVHKAAATGVYRIVATSFAPNEIGAFNLVVTEIAEPKAK